MIDERALAINPIVPDSVRHNSQVNFLSYHSSNLIPPLLCPAAEQFAMQVISQIRSLTASLFGIAAGILGLESYPGFLFYLLGTLVVSVLIWGVLAHGKPESFFESQLSGLWGKDVFGGLSSFVLTWTLFYGLVRS